MKNKILKHINILITAVSLTFVVTIFWIGVSDFVKFIGLIYSILLLFAISYWLVYSVYKKSEE
jgi:hypothetical protein